MPDSRLLSRRILGEHDEIPPELARDLYSRSIELAKSGLGGIRIAKQLSATYSLRVCPGTINHWIYGDREPRLRNIFLEGPSPELSYIIGAGKGDGCVLSKSDCVKLEVTDEDFAQAFNINMARLFSRDRPNKILVRRFNKERLPLYIVKYSSKQLASLLNLPLKKLLRFAVAFPREFLLGFFDAEGHIDVSARGTFTLCAGVENSNRELLTRIKRILRTDFQIESRLNRKRESGSLKVIRLQSFQMRKTSFSLLIRRLVCLEKFAEQIGFSILRKNQKLNDALTILRDCGTDGRPDAWGQLYFKQRGEWVRRSFPASP